MRSATARASARASAIRPNRPRWKPPVASPGRPARGDRARSAVAGRAFRPGRQSAVARRGRHGARRGARRARRAAPHLWQHRRFPPRDLSRDRAGHMAQALPLGLPLRRGRPRHRRAVPGALGQCRDARAARGARRKAHTMTLYVPPHFRLDDRDALYAFMEKYAVGTLVPSRSAGMHVSHIPFLPERGADGAIRLLGHVARANEQWQALEDAAHLVAIFQGPHGYVSPSWYANHPSLPTWKYSAAHAKGKARLIDE